MDSQQLVLIMGPIMLIVEMGVLEFKANPAFITEDITA
jgi:hypothetical protein